MRTTLIIDDELLRQAKRQATERNLTVSDIVNSALRECLSRRPQPAPPFSLVTYGRTGGCVHHEPADFAAALEVEEGPRPRRRC